MGETPEDDTPAAPARIPPRWFVRTFWVAHRAVYTVTRGRVGLSRPKPGRWGMMRLHTVGRRSGKERIAIVAYVEDGESLVTLAMNGWDEAPPAWWLNLQAQPSVRVDLVGGHRTLRAREADGDERERLWALFREYTEGSDLDAYARLRSRSTPVVVLEPDRDDGR